MAGFLAHPVLNFKYVLDYHSSWTKGIELERYERRMSFSAVSGFETQIRTCDCESFMSSVAFSATTTERKWCILVKIGFVDSANENANIVWNRSITRNAVWLMVDQKCIYGANSIYYWQMDIQLLMSLNYSIYLLTAKYLNYAWSQFVLLNM